MDWLSQNWIWVIVLVAFVWMHLYGHGGGHGGCGGHGGHGGHKGDRERGSTEEEQAGKDGPQGHRH